LSALDDARAWLRRRGVQLVGANAARVMLLYLLLAALDERKR